MNNELPIVVKPSRRKWGLWAVAATLGFFACVFLLVFEDHQQDFAYSVAAVVCIVLAPVAVWNFIVVAPVMIIDEYGINGRFFVARRKIPVAGFIDGGGIGGRLAARGLGCVKIAWDDIIGARYVQNQYGGITATMRLVYLEINNEAGKYIPMHRLSQKFAGAYTILGFSVINTELNEQQTEEIVAVINSRAKGKPPEETKESAKSPFATDE